jgi:PAS domain S-box-containing protein
MFFMDSALIPSTFFETLFLTNPTPQAVVALNTMRFVQVNRAFETLCNLSSAQLLSMGLAELTHSAEWPGQRSHIESLLAAGGTHFCFTSRYCVRAAQTLQVRVSGTVVVQQDGSALAMLTVIDTGDEAGATQRSRMQEQLSLATRIINLSGAMLWQWRPDERWSIDYVSDNVVPLLGYYPDTLCGGQCSYLDLVHPQDRPRLCREVGDAIADSGVLEFTHQPYRLVREDGRVCWVEDCTRILRDEQGQIIHFEGVVLDITDSIESRRKQQVLATMIDIAPNAITIHDTAGKFLFANQKTYAMHGFSPHEFAQLNLAELDTPMDAARMKSRFAEIAQQGEARFEVEHYRHDGSIFPLEVYAKQIQWDGHPAVLSIATDISERREVERRLQHSEERYRSMFENMATGVAMYRAIEGGRDFVFESMNAAAERITHITRQEAMGRSLLELFPNMAKAGLLAALEQVWQSGESVHLEPFYHKDGSREGWRENRIYKLPGGEVVALFDDVSERKKSEERLIKNQRLDSLGLLAGGIAHDFNNLLAGIFGYIDMASTESTQSSVRSTLDKAMVAIDRARNLTAQLLTFAKGGSPVLKNEPLVPFLQQTVQFALSGASVECRFELEQVLHWCRMDKNQMAQVIDNLIINAKQAMVQGGTIVVRAGNVRVGAGEFVTLAPGEYVHIAIADSGSGISADHLNRIFDPFFTTKKSGNGLGLATCHAIVKRHGGLIDAESELGVGSVFHLYLPAATAASPAPACSAGATHQGQGTVVVLDDEEVIRDTIGAMLESFGYRPVLLENSSRALDFCKAEAGAGREVVALCCDLTIPGDLGCREIASGVREFFPAIVAFVLSGYGDDPLMQQPQNYGFSASLKKPFMRRELAGLLNKYMASVASAKP